MASAGLLVRADDAAVQDQQRWGERKVYMRKGAGSRKHQKQQKQQGPQPPPGGGGGGLGFAAQGFEHQPMAIAATVAASEDSSSLNRKSISINHDAKRGGAPPGVAVGERMDSGGNSYVMYALSSYSRDGIRELKRKLTKELEQVRVLYSRLESREMQVRDASYSASQFSGNYGGREVTSGNCENNASFSDKRTPKANQYYRNSDFVMGKDKMPPPETKKGSGNPKRKMDARDSKRANVPDPALVKLNADVLKQCGSLLTKLMKHKHAWIFNTPVDVIGLGLHDYNSIIKLPMDLGSIKKKLNEWPQYSTPLDFAADVRLTFNNAMTYNPEGHDVHIMAQTLLNFFEERWKPICDKYEDERSKFCWPMEGGGNQNIKRLPIGEPPKKNLKKTQPLLGLSPPPPQPKVKPMKANPPARTPAPKKPKAKDPHKREMTYDEKQKLSASLQDLPPEKLENIVQIIKKRNSHLCQQEDEIEVDIDSFDTETLWELDRYVSNCKKSMSKNKKKLNGIEQPEAQPVPMEDASAPPVRKEEKSPAPAVGETPKKPKKGDQGEEDVDIDDDMPSTNFPPVDIGKEAGYASRSSSSSSSSSDSGSSSSDSDSGSSSGSDSDGDDGQSPAAESRPPRS